MSVCWTEEQQQVIELRNRNILVSAAAGSGKTAVLVERIITRLTVDQPPIDVDRLLIVTYTEAAAAEMKGRIRDAIEKKLEQCPGDMHLQRQVSLVHNALITTIHSFCLSVIRDHFHTIDLDPSFRIAEEGELKLLKHDVLQHLLEVYYENGTEEFFSFVEYFATGKDDRKIEELILQLYEFSRSYPEPIEWLQRCVTAYDVTDKEQLESTPFMKVAYNNIAQELEDAIQLIRIGIDACREIDGPSMYLPALQTDLQQLENMQNAKLFEKLFQCGKVLKWERLAPNRDKNISEELTVLVKNVRTQVKEIVENIIEQYLYQEPEELQKDLLESKPVMEMLCTLVQHFDKAFAEEKAAKNLIDFGDMEQFALKILTVKEDGIRVASQVAKEYQKRFQEVMIDEYQDSNLIQEAILTSVSMVDQGIYNIFMVGDVKQSIYRFRLSRPELFMEKFHRYTQEESQCQRVDLHKNFRSRREVLESTNFIFEQIMTRKLGGVEYDDKAALYVGANYAATTGKETEVLLVNTNVSTQEEVEFEETNRELEARAVARRIKELLVSQFVVDKQTGEYRKAEYRDIVILTRSLKGWTDVFAKILNREGIPTFTGSKEGYFETREVALLLDYLSILDNPKQDLPLTAVMSSIFGGFTKEELANIKSANSKVPFHEAIFSYGTSQLLGSVNDSSQINKVLGCKLNRFLNQWGEFRKKVPYTAIHELLWQIIEETGYGTYVSAMPGGIQRKANVDMLVEKAMSFETTSYKGLFNFIRYIAQLKKYDIDYGEASTANECDNTVRLMSIHKSKGLEFPIVFVAGMSKRFNIQDTKGSIVIHPELGIGMDAINLKQRTKSPTLLKKIIQKQIILENLGEELRVLYVALTRAKEKLILIGTVSNFEKKMQLLGAMKGQQERSLTFHSLAKANTYYDWILPALARNQAFNGIWEMYGMTVPFNNPLYNNPVPISIYQIGLEELVTGEIIEELEDFVTKENINLIDKDRIYDLELKEQIKQQFSFRYAYQEEQKFKMKFTVSELKKRRFLEEEAGETISEEMEIIPLLPKFMIGEKERHGAFKGSAYHKLLELLDVSRTYKVAEIEEMLVELQVQGAMSEEEVTCIIVKDIVEFLKSSIGQRIKLAAINQQLYKEQPFVLGVAAEEIYKQKSREMILVQGIIDVYFEEGDELIVLDYKTDRITKLEELKDRYQSQLDYYAKALEELTGKVVKEKLIYSFAKGEVLRL